MDDTISRQAAIEGAKELFALGDCHCDEHSIVGMLNSLPSTQSEHPKGKWIRDSRYICGYNCSICDSIVYRNGYNFCPHCGADMREGNKE